MTQQPKSMPPADLPPGQATGGQRSSPARVGATGMRVSGVQQCPNCGALSHSHATVCPECGEGLRSKPKSIRCRRCHQRTPSNLTLCPHCGRELHAAPSRWLTWGGPVLLVLLFLLVLVGRWNSGNPISLARSGVERSVDFVTGVGEQMDPRLVLVATPEGIETTAMTAGEAAAVALVETAAQQPVASAAEGGTGAPGEGDGAADIESSADATVILVPTETPTAGPTATETPTVEPTATPTSEPTETPTVEPTATATNKPTATPTGEPTSTNEPTATVTRRATATATEEPTATRRKPTATRTAIPSPTSTRRATATADAAAEPEDDLTVTATPQDDSDAPSAAEGLRAAALSQQVTEPLTGTAGLLTLPTPTSTSTATRTPRATATAQPAAETPDPSRTPTATATRRPTATRTPTTSALPTATPAPESSTLLSLPTPTPAEADIEADTQADTVPEVVRYTVRSGDTALGIALRFDVSLERFLAVNELSPDSARNIRPGQELIIPNADTPLPQATVEPTPTPQATLYTVSGGDTALGIARRFDISLNALIAANGLTAEAARLLRPGQELIIPAAGQPVEAAPTATPTEAAPAPTPDDTSAQRTDSFRLDTPLLRSPENGAPVSCRSQDSLAWNAVPFMQDSDRYIMYLGFVTGKDENGDDTVTWVLNQPVPHTRTSWDMDSELCSLAPQGLGRRWRWYVQVVDEDANPVSVPSEVWGFSWN